MSPDFSAATKHQACGIIILITIQPYPFKCLSFFHISSKITFQLRGTRLLPERLHLFPKLFRFLVLYQQLRVDKNVCDAKIQISPDLLSNYFTNWSDGAGDMTNSPIFLYLNRRKRSLSWIPWPIL